MGWLSQVAGYREGSGEVQYGVSNEHQVGQVNGPEGRWELSFLLRVEDQTQLLVGTSLFYSLWLSPQMGSGSARASQPKLHPQ